MKLSLALSALLMLFAGGVLAEEYKPIIGSFKGSNMEFSLKCAALFQLTTMAPDNDQQFQEVATASGQLMGGLVVDNYKVARISIGRRELKYKRLEVVDRLYLGYPKNKIVLFQTYERCNEFIQYIFKNYESYDDFGLTRIQPPERKEISEERKIILDNMFKTIMANGKKLLLQQNFSKPSDVYKAFDKELGIKEY